MKPLLLLDVDGPLNPYAAKPTRRPVGYETHRITPAGWRKPLRVWLKPEHGPALLALAERADVELAWCTTWLDEANVHIGPRIGLPELPVVPFRFDDAHWKFDAALEFAGDRPLLWFDDDFKRYPTTIKWFLGRRAASTFLYEIDPAIGLVAGDLAVAEVWLTDLVRKGSA